MPKSATSAAILRIGNRHGPDYLARLMGAQLDRGAGVLLLGDRASHAVAAFGACELVAPVLALDPNGVTLPWHPIAQSAHRAGQRTERATVTRADVRRFALTVTRYTPAGGPGAGRVIAEARDGGRWYLFGVPVPSDPPGDPHGVGIEPAGPAGPGRLQDRHVDE